MSDRTRETKTVVDQYGVIWCTEKAEVYAPLSLDPTYVPSPELIVELEKVGMRVTRVYMHARITLQDEVKENENPSPTEIKGKLGHSLMGTPLHRAQSREGR